MGKYEIAATAAKILRNTGFRKTVNAPSSLFHISDNYGNSKDFSIRGGTYQITLSSEDVIKVFDAVLQAIVEELKKGEKVSFRRFGLFYLKFRKPRSTKMVGSDERVYIPGHYVVKFSPGEDLKTCCKLYELSIADEISPGMQDDYDYVDSEYDDDLIDDLFEDDTEITFEPAGDAIDMSPGQDGE